MRIFLPNCTAAEILIGINVMPPVSSEKGSSGWLLSRFQPGTVLPTSGGCASRAAAIFCAGTR
jgi:hypothetical protein